MATGKLVKKTPGAKIIGKGKFVKKTKKMPNPKGRGNKYA